jgi:hypothetical protein
MTIQDIRSDDFYISSLTKDSIIEYIFQEDSKYYLLSSDYDLLEDVSKMPDYIQSDWINEYKKDLNLMCLNKHIKKSKSNLDIYLKGTNDYKVVEDGLNKLISIRRDFIIKGII